jgi:hypothetical protein
LHCSTAFSPSERRKGSEADVVVMKTINDMQHRLLSFGEITDPPPAEKVRNEVRGSEAECYFLWKNN